MKAGAACPQPDELRQLLEGSLSGDRQHACTEHMDSCECCQAKLEELATGGTNLNQLVAHLNADEPVSTSPYWPALQALDADLRETFVPKAGIAKSPPVKPRRDVSLEFLQPSSDAAYLGRMAEFDVMRVIGRGGMGIVLEAFDSHLQRHVALKVLHPELAEDETARQRFCREARAAASITHENVVAVHQVARSGEHALPYLVMQLISGESLEERLAREKRLPFREIVRIGMQAARGLAAAHAQGLIHRDIKPGNILLETVEQRVKLTDFGLARAAEDIKLTRTGFVSGTPMYMAPEQALGEEAGPQSDLFSLGAVLYEMCAGQPPFTGNSALAVLKQIAETKPRPLWELNPETPDWFANTIDRLLAKKPGDRIASAAQLAELLEFEWAIMKTTSEDVPQVCQIEEQKQVRRNRWFAAAVAAIFLTLGVFAGALLSRREEPAAPVSEAAKPLAVLSGNPGTVWSVSFDAPHDLLALAVEEGSVRVWDLDSVSVKSTFPAHRGVVWSTRFSRDGNLLATAGDDGLVKLWNSSQSEPVKILHHPNAVRSIALSQDEQTLFAGDRAGGIKAWSLESERPIAEATAEGAIYAVALSPDQKTLVTAGSEKLVRVWNAEHLTSRFTLEGHSGPVYGLSFHPDSDRLASVGWDKTVRIWDTKSGQLATTWPGHAGDIWGVAYSPDGTQLATGGHEGAVRLWNARTGELLATYEGHELAVHTVAFHPDGRRLASGSRDGTVRIWAVE